VRRRLSLVPLAGLLLVATACGSQANSYRKQVDVVQKRYAPKLAPLEVRLSKAIAARQTADAALAASQARGEMTRFMHDVAAIQPPSSLKARSVRLVSAYGRLASSLQELTTALRAKAPTRVNRAIASYNNARLDEASAVAALNQG
jgi:hypothetical protein